MSALTLTLGRAFFAGFLLGVGLWHLLAKMAIRYMMRRLARLSAEQSTDLIHAFAEAVEEPDEDQRRSIFFEAVEVAMRSRQETSR